MIAKFKYQEWENKQRSVKMNNNNPADQPAIQKITINFKQGRKAIRYLYATLTPPSPSAQMTAVRPWNLVSTFCVLSRT